MQTQLRARFLADSTISTNCGTRVDWSERPQGKPLPAITLEIVLGQRDQTMDGLQATQGPDIQIDCWAETRAMAVTLREAAIALIAATATQGGVRFRGASDIRHSGMVEKTDSGVIHREMIRATLWHTT